MIYNSPNFVLLYFGQYLGDEDLKLIFLSPKTTALDLRKTKCTRNNTTHFGSELIGRIESYHFQNLFLNKTLPHENEQYERSRLI